MNKAHTQNLRTVGGPYATVLKMNPNEPRAVRKYYESLKEADKLLERCSLLEQDYNRVTFELNRANSQISAMRRETQEQLAVMRRTFITVDMANILQAQIDRLQQQVDGQSARRPDSTFQPQQPSTKRGRG